MLMMMMTASVDVQDDDSYLDDELCDPLLDDKLCDLDDELCDPCLEDELCDPDLDDRADSGDCVLFPGADHGFDQ